MANYLISDSDRAMVQGVLDWARGRRFSTPLRDGPTPSASDSQSPEVYIVKVPVGGIDALSLAGSDETPGVATCDIYWIDDAGVLVEILYQQPVYNITTTDVAAGSYILAVRDKMGRWIGVAPAGVSGWTGTITHYDVSWNETTCIMTKVSQSITVVNGLITAVGSWV